ncbi:MULTISPECIES: DoxX family protein [unclassified Cobetia]|uniref:DoxX family protein n=1 Tax=unclassified Cobetia TaxID=2609414 RepID=UPI0020973991|nr:MULTISPECIES: DoxX family protein [unclassified Cobetia]MCO7233511.1 DoxX family protein [Cobetia sp. Dlab-2-AX]MCO7236787.1 DoxX family protein [Cobetia sp. Dlab-2-U]
MFKSALSRLMTTDSSLASLVLRVPTGIIFMAHGSQKLFGAFGGYGLEGTGQWMASMGIEPGYLMALLSGSGEFFGGLAILIGLLTRPAAAVLAFTMLVAILTVHIGNGLFMSNNGYEYGLALLTIAASLAITGGGKLSLDRLLSPARHVA